MEKNFFSLCNFNSNVLLIGIYQRNPDSDILPQDWFSVTVAVPPHTSGDPTPQLFLQGIWFW